MDSLFINSYFLIFPPNKVRIGLAGATLTHIVDDEALALAEDEPCWIGVEGDGQVGGGGGELEGAAPSDVAPQDTSCDLVAVGDGQHVTVADVQSEDGQEGKKRTEYSQWHQLRTSHGDSQCRHVDSRLCGRQDDLEG